jgi:nucleotide-binding universal stress UspA family protein
MYKRILLAYDGSQTGQKALLDCRDMANLAQAELFLIAVRPPATAFIGGEEAGIYDPEREKDEERQYQGIFDDGLKRLSELGRPAQGELVVGDAVDEITRYAKKIAADLVVVGHKHLEGWAARWWRGSVSKSLIAQSPCSVLVVITR